MLQSLLDLFLQAFNLIGQWSLFQDFAWLFVITFLFVIIFFFLPGGHKH